MNTTTKATIDRDVIRRWAQARRGKPSRVQDTGGGKDPGILRIDFPGYSGEDTLETIEWEEFFAKFDANGLALVYQEKTADGKKSNFNKLVKRSSVKQALEAVDGAAMQTLGDAFLHELKDMLSAEKQIVGALPRLIKSATDEEVKQALQDHLQETREQVKRVEQALRSVGEKPQSETCEGMKGLLEEGAELVAQEGDPAVKDMLLISAAQKVEHYEISAYGALCTWAESLEFAKATQLLKENMREEKEADARLTKLAARLLRRTLVTA
jgi:ferritin-like metal-binding protein YciE